MKAPRSLPLLLLFTGVVTGCLSPDDSHDGTAVGNPGVVAFALASLGGELNLDGAEVEFSAGSVSACGEDDKTELEVPNEPFLMNGEIALEVPTGVWCSFTFDEVEVGIAGELVGTVEDVEFQLDLVLDTVALNTSNTTGFTVTAEQGFIVEFGAPEWLAAEDIGLDDGESVSVEPGDLLHDELADTLVSGSALYDDTDQDGNISEVERAAGPKAATVNPLPVVNDGDDNSAPACSTSPGNDSRIFALLSVLAMLARRRRS